MTEATAVTDLTGATATKRCYVRPKCHNHIKFVLDVHSLWSQYDVSIYKSNVLEETLLKILGIEAVPTDCQFNVHQEDLTMTKIKYFGFTDEQNAEFVDRFNKKYGDCSRIVVISNDEMITLGQPSIGKPIPHQFILIKSKVLVKKVFADLKNEIVSNPHLLEKYKKISNRKNSPDIESWTSDVRYWIAGSILAACIVSFICWH